MTTLVCITNSHSLRDVRSCVFRGEHLDGCTGFEARWSTDRHQYEYTDRECRGCLPRPAERGLLCWACASKLDEALRQTGDLVPHLRSIERGPSDGVLARSAPGSRVILPTSWITADELWVLLQATADGYAHDWAAEPLERDVTASTTVGFHPEAPINAVMLITGWMVEYLQADPDRLVAGELGAANAVRYTKRLQRALTEFPLEQKSRPVRYIRCRACHQATLRQNPPLEYEGPIVIECSNLLCKALYDVDTVMTDLREYREQLQQDAAVKAAAERAEARARKAVEKAAAKAERDAA